jgi:ribose/xylose/arabinose/galactoside ABC-type transport system permease subunit
MVNRAAASLSVAREGAPPQARWAQVQVVVQRVGIYGAILILFAVAAVERPQLLSAQSLFQNAEIAAILGVAAIGQTFVITARGFDISQGSVMTLVIVLANRIMNGEASHILPGVLAALVAGLLVGLVNGVFVSYLGIPSIVTTLGAQFVVLGAALVYTGGLPVGQIPPQFHVLGVGTWEGVPIAMIIWLVLSAIAALYLRVGLGGRILQAIGANERAVRVSGINVRRYGMLPYLLAGLCSALAGLLFAAYTGLPDIQAAKNFTLQPIAAVVLGGTPVTGGEGSMFGSAAGAFFITFLSSVILSMNASEGVREMITGAIIIVAVAAVAREATAR